MKKYITTIILCLQTVVLFGQSFEGTLVYKTDFEFHISEKMAVIVVTEEMMRERMKKEGDWVDSIKTSYKGGNYITYPNFSTQNWIIYNPKTHKTYIFDKRDKETADICVVTDVSAYVNNEKPTIEKLDTIAEVNGIKCEVVRVKWRLGTYDYYYNSSMLRVDAKLFKNHIYDGLADFLKISNALPIRIVKVTGKLATVTFTLTRYSEETIDPKLFEIPKLEVDNDLNFLKKLNIEMMRIKK